jgi:hypothetical protein
LWDYIEKRDIDYLVDSDYSILKDYRDFYGPGWDAQEHIVWIAKIDDPAVSWAGADVSAYRVIKQGAASESGGGPTAVGRQKTSTLNSSPRRP